LPMAYDNKAWRNIADIVAICTEFAFCDPMDSDKWEAGDLKDSDEMRFFGVHLEKVDATLRPTYRTTDLALFRQLITIFPEDVRGTEPLQLVEMMEPEEKKSYMLLGWLHDFCADSQEFLQTIELIVKKSMIKDADARKTVAKSCQTWMSTFPKTVPSRRLLGQNPMKARLKIREVRKKSLKFLQTTYKSYDSAAFGRISQSILEESQELFHE